MQSAGPYTTTYEGPGERTFQYTTTQAGDCGDAICPEVTAELTITVIP